MTENMSPAGYEPETLGGLVARRAGNLLEALAEMREHLEGAGRRGQADEARRRVEDARAVSCLVSALRRGGRNAGDVHVLQGYGDVVERVAAAG